jgi:hypothetical protein
VGAPAQLKDSNILQAPEPTLTVNSRILLCLVIGALLPAFDARAEKSMPPFARRSFN